MPYLTLRQDMNGRDFPSHLRKHYVFGYDDGMTYREFYEYLLENYRRPIIKHRGEIIMDENTYERDDPFPFDLFQDGKGTILIYSPYLGRWD